jgi:hypothetical protein
VSGLVASLDGLKTLHATRRGPRAEAHAAEVTGAAEVLAMIPA